jgi:two-component system chemotaxis response regulator CheB
VIDDSAFSRQAITRMLETSPLVEVVGSARDGEEALRKTLELEPDLVTLDLEMPRMDGFTFLRVVMRRRPTPVIVVSRRSERGDVFKALELGAVDFLVKPTPRATPELAAIEMELLRKVHAVGELRIDRVRDRLHAVPAPIRHAGAAAAPPRTVAIGASTGGPAALMQIFGAFAQPPPCAFVVAQHMPEGFTRGFADRLDRLTSMRAREACGGEVPTAGEILVAPGGHHLELESQADRAVTRVVPSCALDKYVPSVDRLFASAAKLYGADLVAVVLTGMGDDGALGARAVANAGGAVIAESGESAVIFGMPRQAIRSGAVDRVLPLHEIAAAIQTGAHRARSAIAAAPAGRSADAGGAGT